MGRIKKNIKLICDDFSDNTLNCIDESNINNNSLNINNNSLNINDDLTNVNIDVFDFKKKEKMLFDVINEFFKKCSNEDIFKIIDIINGKYKISLRFLDWFVTRYCYLYKTSISVNNNYNKEQNFNINISYKAQLKSFKKKCFDPFKRKNKFYYSFNTANDDKILTTLGQLNFFKWALSYDIINYVENNFNVISDKILHVNSFFKKIIIDDNTHSLISSDVSSCSDLNNNLPYKSNNKNILHYAPIVSRNILVEL